MKQTLNQAFKDRRVNKRYSSQGTQVLTEVALECILSETLSQYVTFAEIRRIIMKRFSGAPSNVKSKDILRVLNSHPWFIPVDSGKYRIKRDFLDIEEIAV